MTLRTAKRSKTAQMFLVILFIKTDHFATKPLVRVDCIDEQCKFELYAVRKIALLIKT